MGNCSALPQLFCLSCLARTVLTQGGGGREDGGKKMFKKEKKSASHVVQKYSTNNVWSPEDGRGGIGVKHPPTPCFFSPFSSFTLTLSEHHTPFHRATLSMCSDSDEPPRFPLLLTQSSALPCWSCNWLVTGLGSTSTLHQLDFNPPH